MVTTLNPSSEFQGRLKELLAQLDQVLIVDNASGAEVCERIRILAETRANINIIFNEKNLGVAAALNQAFAWAIAKDFTHVIAFDQDSIPAPGMVSILSNAFDFASRNGRVAIAAPYVVDPLVVRPTWYVRPKGRFTFERVTCPGPILDNILTVITSGALYDLDIYQRLGPFREDFFIDYVDVEYCLRARENGYSIIVVCDAHLYHRLGNQQKRIFLGRISYPTFHSSLRWYYISRNRIQMLRRYGLRFPQWLIHELGVSIKSILRMLMLEDQRIAKLKALFLGTQDGLRGRMGKIPDKIEKLLV